MNWSTKKQLATKAIVMALRCRKQHDIPNIAPVDPVDLSEKFNCDVWFKDISSLEGMYSPDPRETIVVGSLRPSGRKNFTCAHELGHFMFKHGARLDQLGASPTQSPNEFLADTFAGHLLMPQLAVKNILKRKKISEADLSPLQVYWLASYFGVGYATIVYHLTWSLNLISNSKMEELLQISPKDIKGDFDTAPNKEIVFADTFWEHRPINLEVGDRLVLADDISVDQSEQLMFLKSNNGYSLWEVTAPGYSRAKKEDWAVIIRVSRKNYVGLARYRFYKEIEED